MSPYLLLRALSVQEDPQRADRQKDCDDEDCSEPAAREIAHGARGAGHRGGGRCARLRAPLSYAQTGGGIGFAFDPQSNPTPILDSGPSDWGLCPDRHHELVREHRSGLSGLLVSHLERRRVLAAQR